MGRFEGRAAREWSQPLTFDCGKGFWKMCEDLDGNLFIGEYAGGYNDTCAFIWRSRDAGTTWDKCYNGTERHVHFVACDPYSGKLYAAVGDGAARAGILRSEDAGDTWDVIHWGDLFAQPISIVFTPTHRVFGSDFGMLWPWNSVYRSDDDADFIDQLILAGSENTFPWAMSINEQGTIFAGTITRDDGGDRPAIYMSYDGGAFWCKAKDLGLIPDPWRGVTWISNFDSAGYAYYHNSYAFETYRFNGDFPLDVPEAVEETPRLSAPNPNPFASGTRMEFSVPDLTECVRVAIYDLRGRHVRTVVEGTFEGGTHPVSWDGRDERGRPVSSGVYFARLEVGSETSGQKLLLVK